MAIDSNQQNSLLVAHINPPVWLKQTSKINSGDALILVETAQDAVSIINKRQCNLIIIDSILSSDEIISIVKTNSINASTPILALIEQNEFDHRKSLITAGFDDCLVKPLTLNSLTETIAFWLGCDHPCMYINSIEKLLTNCRNNRKLAVTLYKKLFAVLPEYLDNIEMALKQGNYKLALDTVHSLNGSVKTCFLMPIEDISNNLESTLSEEKLDLAQACFLMLKQKINAFMEQREDVLNYLENPGAG